MARQKRLGASKAVNHFFHTTEMSIIKMIDERVKEKRKTYSTAVRVNANTLKRKAIHA